MKSIKIIVFSMLLLTLALAVYSASAPVIGLLPASNSVKGFSILSGSKQYAKGNELTNIYDGGYELYTKNDVIDAVRQMYQRKGEYVEVTIHTMKSQKAAMDFLNYWQKTYKVKSQFAVSSGFIINKPTTAAYYVKNKYFYTVTSFKTDASAMQSVKAFVAVINKKIK